MPQPLSRVKPDAQIEIGSGDSILTPALTTFLGRVVSAWAHVEFQLGRSLAYLLRTDEEVGLRLFAALNSRAQRDAIDSLTSTLSEQERELFASVVQFVRSVQKQRNRVVHSIWATSKDLPDRYLLLSQDTVVRFRLSIDQPFAADPKGTHTTYAFTPDDIQVYNKSDFDSLIDDVLSADGAIDHFWLMMNTGDPARRSQYYQKLTSAPQIRAFLERRRSASQKSTPPDPPQSNQPDQQG